jgi:serine/threonine protein kinase
MASDNQPRVSDDWRTISAVVDRYEEQVGPQLPELAPFLEGVPAESRVKVLAALVEVEQELRWKRQQGKTVEEYLNQFPELRGQEEVVRELACAECRLRCRTGGENFRKEFTCRFPNLDLECDTRRPGSTTIEYQPHGGNCKGPRVRPCRIGRYRVESRVGSGAFGVVYRCRHPELDRRVAIKIARQASHSADGFLHEAQNVAGLRHPNLVNLLDYGTEEDGRPYIVYEYVAGPTLAERIAAQDYKLGDALRWTIAVAGVLQAAHRQRIYHRDIKPGNILIDEEGNARLTDFGLASRDESFYRNDHHVCLGTPWYMSPEQASSHADWAGPASDIYSLGVVLYELLCRRVPFPVADSDELMQQIRERAPVPPRSLNDRVPARVEEVCLRALAKDPAQRFRTADDFARALQDAAEPARSRLFRPVGCSITLVVTCAIALVAVGIWRLRPQMFSTPLPAPGSLAQAELTTAAPRAEAPVHIAEYGPREPTSSPLPTFKPSSPQSSDVPPAYTNAYPSMREPPVAIPPTAALQAMYPRLDLVKADGTLHELKAPQLPRSGDQFECFAELNRPAYLYVILFSSRGPARVIWPGAARLKDPVLDRFGRCPAEGEEKLTIPPGKGVMTVLVAGCNKPLNDARLQQLLAEPFAWPEPRHGADYQATAYPTPTILPEYVRVRGNGDARLFELPREFKPQVEGIFDTYFAVMFSWLDTPDGAASPVSKAPSQATNRRTVP